MLPTSVTVSPSSSSDAGSNARSGQQGDTNFYFGGNPTAAALGIGGKGGQSTWAIAAVAAVAAILLLAALRR